MKKFSLFVAMIWIISGVVLAQEETGKKHQFSLLGGISHILEYGSEEDYVLGENDFPVTPGHTPPFFGLSFSYYLADKIKMELDWRYVFNSEVILTDPSDGDTVAIDTSKQHFTSLSFVYQFLRSKFRPYFLVGGGLNKLLAKTQSYVTNYGYEIDLEVPDKTTALFAQIGGGVDALLSSALGIKLDVRFVYLFSDPDNIYLLFAGLGAYFLF
jgi:outer membrane protein W